MNEFSQRSSRWIVLHMQRGLQLSSAVSIVIRSPKVCGFRGGRGLTSRGRLSGVGFKIESWPKRSCRYRRTSNYDSSDLSSLYLA